MSEYAYRDPNRFRLDYYDQTTLHPTAFALMVVVLIGIWFLPRRAVVFPLVIGLALIAASQRLVVAGVDFQTLRIFGLMALARFLIRNEVSGVRIQMIDKVFVVGMLIPVPFTVLRGQPHLFMQEAGFFLDATTMYLVGRVCLGEARAMPWLIGGLVVSTLCVLPWMAIEKATSWNFFSFYSGIPEYSQVRVDKVRVQAAFAHPIILGVWFATAVPLAFCLLPVGRQRSIQVLAAATAAGVFITGVFISGTSTAVGATLASLLMLAWYPARRYTATCAKCLAVVAIAVHFASTNGVHHLLLTRFTFMAGSTGYHRYALIDNCMNNFGEWFLIGSSRGSYHWGYGMDDVTCEYVSKALKSGIVGLSLLIAMIVVGVRSMVEVFRGGDRVERIIAYCLAVTILSHAVSFIGVSYFGQGYFSFYAVLGMAGAWMEGFRRRQAAGVPAIRGNPHGNPRQWARPRTHGQVQIYPALLGQGKGRDESNRSVEPTS